VLLGMECETRLTLQVDGMALSISKNRLFLRFCGTESAECVCEREREVQDKRTRG
jgi:hypothetical protein